LTTRGVVNAAREPGTRSPAGADLEGSRAKLYADDELTDVPLDQGVKAGR
jgi:hypothetical protein